ncbi:uncharacterized protein LOC142521822 [Primulina tabacum]|uniref:uncharacterized protein LOC142521822 n=1 Tax=Primulina tabacum TaxID=48773 RepID=UPI003F59386A
MNKFKEIVKKNVDDNEAHMQSGKDAMSRCSSTCFRKIMNKLEPKLNERQQARIISTPFGKCISAKYLFDTHIDDLPKFFGYSWGDAAHRFLCDKISAHIGNLEGAIGRKTYLDGCVVGMMVFEIIPFGKELELFGHRRRNVNVSSKIKDEETTCKIRRLEKLVEDQFHDIQILRQMCCESNENTTKDGGDGRVDVKVDEGKHVDKNVSFEDFDTDLGGYNEVHHVDVVTDLIKCDDVGFTKLDMELNKVRMEDSSREVADERDDGNGVISSQEGKVNNVIYSIVKNVTTRTDRVKKRKPNMFVTPPSSTPRRKTKSDVECKEYRVISDEGETSVEDEKVSADKDESKLKNFRGRQDFCGCEEVSDKERNIIIKYLTWEKLSGTVWEGERFKICGIEFCDLLFGDALKDNIINCYMKIVSGYSRKMDEVLGALQR